MSEKRVYDVPFSAAGSRRGRRGTAIGLVALASLVLSVPFVLRNNNGDSVGHRACHTSNAPEAFDWDAVVPSEKLEWHACEGKFECARLTVPLNYAEPSGDKAAIALIKLPSKIPPDEDGYRGPILFNPGGPSGSGVETILRSGENFQKILGDDYDLVGFDPRGVGRTDPSVYAFPTLAEGVAWQLTEGPVMNATTDSLARAYARGQIMGGLIEERGRRAAEHVSTPMVARDMLSIVRAHGREKLQYWGFSYGTVLGITYASMFPDNVERVLVDGVVDTYNYMQAEWSNNLRDTDKIMDQFYDACAAAGPSLCALHEPTADAVHARLDALWAKLRCNPVAVQGNDSYGLVDYTLARRVVFQWLYKPFQQAPVNATVLAHALAALERGEGAPMRALESPDLEPKLECECGGAPARPQGGREVLYAIACGDGPEIKKSVEEVQAHYEEMARDSSFAETWMIHVNCAGWKVRSKEQFFGPFVGNTSFPVMLIGNTADPVTPLYNAHKMAKGFKDAVVLTQNSPGHCSPSATSLCTIKHIREYFREGKLPAANTVCEVEDSMFPGGAAHAVQEAMLSAEDLSLLEAARALGADLEIPYMH